MVDLERTAATIVRTGADFIALQELDRNVRRSGGVDQAARLGELTSMWIRFFPTTRLDGGDFGLAIAASAPLELQFHPLPKTPLDRPHGMITSRLRGVEVLATHLSRKRISRAVELAWVCSACRRLDPPKMLLGDLNTTGLSFRSMRVAGLERRAGYRPTFPSRLPRRQIDHVLTSRGLTVIDCWTVDSEASDHLPLVVEVES